MSRVPSIYSLELRSPSGLLLADLSGRARKRRFSQSRNASEEIQWDLDINELEVYARDLKRSEDSLIIPGSTEVRVKRLGQYLVGGRISYAGFSIDPNKQIVSIRASGFLDMFADRLTGTTTAGTVQETFTAVEKTTIASTLITQSQALTNGNMGITIGTMATVGAGDKSYSQTNIRDALVAMTAVDSKSFDFEFTPDKVFNTYAAMGSSRPDVVFEHPGNILEIGVENDATRVANQIMALGRGFGEQSSTSVEANDSGSQLTYSLRQKIITTNGTDNSDNGITDAANAELSAYAFPYELPIITVSGSQNPAVSQYSIGDYVKVKISSYRTLTHINGMYRVEKRVVTIDENDDEVVQIWLGV
jgi:hypothetical protein